jgi:hypothetical protein
VTTRKPSAVKRGRNPKFPYVPVVVVTTDNGPDRFPTVRTHNTNAAVAYATRAEAVAHAQRWLDTAQAVWAATPH